MEEAVEGVRAFSRMSPLDAEWIGRSFFTPASVASCNTGESVFLGAVSACLLLVEGVVMGSSRLLDLARATTASFNSSGVLPVRFFGVGRMVSLFPAILMM